jgi:sugar phosphate permease
MERFNHNKRIRLMWIIATLYVPYQFLLRGLPSVMIPELMNSLKISVVDVGVLCCCFFYSYLALQIPSGILIDRYGVRGLLTATILICAFACLLFAFAQQLFIAELSRFLMGIVASASVVSALYLASNWFSVQRFGLLAGFMEMLGMLGGAVGQASLANMR